ncbi:MAG TPA: tRNA lysidine(34) synthetase TilS, partial [Rubrobacter sp.]|nr:tRNA lysidine(34) synthetase TilS [Rubrobacter sp.]
TRSKYGRRFEQRLQEQIKAEELIERGERVLVALSGGPDSMALLAALFHLREHLKVELAVGHFDHQLRENSADDAEFCRRVAEGLGLPFHGGRGDVRALAKNEARSVEDAARSARYGFLAEAAGAEDCSVVATGHNADDQAETVLMRLLRGSGGSGLRAMHGRGRFPMKGARDLVLVRPLLETERSEIERYSREENLEPRDDTSNTSLEFTRNRLRHEILPRLRELNPAVDQALRRAARSLSRDEDYLEAEAETQLRQTESDGVIPRERLLSLHPALAVRVLRMAGRRRGVQLQADESDKLLELVRAGRGRLDVSSEWTVKVSDEAVTWNRR